LGYFNTESGVRVHRVGCPCDGRQPCLLTSRSRISGGWSS